MHHPTDAFALQSQEARGQISGVSAQSDCVARSRPVSSYLSCLYLYKATLARRRVARPLNRSVRADLTAAPTRTKGTWRLSAARPRLSPGRKADRTRPRDTDLARRPVTRATANALRDQTSQIKNALARQRPREPAPGAARRSAWGRRLHALLSLLILLRRYFPPPRSRVIASSSPFLATPPLCAVKNRNPIALLRARPHSHQAAASLLDRTHAHPRPPYAVAAPTVSSEATTARGKQLS